MRTKLDLQFSFIITLHLEDILTEFFSLLFLNWAKEVLVQWWRAKQKRVTPPVHPLFSGPVRLQKTNVHIISVLKMKI